jgi:hypothetical protein
MVTGSIAGCLQSRWLMPLSSTMTRLNYLMEAPSDCGPEDANFLAFVEVTYIIGGCDAKKEFIACALWPLSEKFRLKVEVKESPLSKVVVPMPQVTTVIGAQEPGTAFEVQIANVTNLLVANYNITEHNAYRGLRHGRLNHILELAGVLCQPQPKPIRWKCKSTAVAPALALRKALKEWRCARGSSHSETQTSVQELALAKPMKPSKKFVAQSSGLNITEKTSSTNLHIAGKKTSSASSGRSDMT